MAMNVDAGRCPDEAPSDSLPSVRHPFAPMGPLSTEEILDRNRAAHLRLAAKAWGADNVSQFRMAESRAFLALAFRRERAPFDFLGRCSPEERTALGIVKLHGGALTGCLLTIEAEHRGLLEAEHRRSLSFGYDFGRRRSRDPVSSMIEALALVPLQHWSERAFPDVTLNPCLAQAVEPAEPIPWPGEVLETAPRKTVLRSQEEVLQDFGRIADYLIGRTSFPVNKFDWPTQPVLEGIAKAAALPRTDSWSRLNERAWRSGDWRRGRQKPFSTRILSHDVPHSLPDPEALSGGLFTLSGLTEIDRERRRGRLTREAWEQFSQLRPDRRAGILLRAWLEMALWQSGIGKVEDRDDKYDPERIPPWELLPAKHTLVWGLSLLPRSGAWVTLDEFLHHLHRLTAPHYGVCFCWERFVWGVRFPLAEQRESLPPGAVRSEAFWLAQEGQWVANVLLVTFVWLGLIERGRTGRGRERRYVFRLTSAARDCLEGRDRHGTDR
jgi:hypothetical protein